MPKIDISLEAELKWLNAELTEARRRAAAALRIEPPGHMLEGAALARALAEEGKVAALVRRIKQIQVGDGQAPARHAARSTVSVEFTNGGQPRVR